MVRVTSSAGRWPLWLSLSLGLLISSAPGPALAQQGSSAAVVGCSWTGSGPAADTSDDTESDNDDGGDPRIGGSVMAPPDVDEDDQEALGPLATVSRDQAVQIALAAIPDADRRRVAEVELEIEHGYVFWEVEAILQRGESGPDKIVEVVVDAGSGQVVFIECEQDDD